MPALFDTRTVPKWTREDAIAAAGKYLSEERPRIKVYLGVPIATYVQTQINSKFSPGVWRITWPRVDSRGYPFEDDGVRIVIPEGRTPLAIDINQGSLYAEQSVGPMSEATGLENARKRIASEGFWTGVLDPLHKHFDWTDRTPTSAYLEIIHPRHDFAQPSRLAWIFWFKRHLSDHTHYPLAYFIDALNGDYLGGDAVGLDSPD